MLGGAGLRKMVGQEFVKGEGRGKDEGILKGIWTPPATEWVGQGRGEGGLECWMGGGNGGIGGGWARRGGGGGTSAGSGVLSPPSPPHSAARTCSVSMNTVAGAPMHLRPAAGEERGVGASVRWGDCQ